ncbi:MAG: DUF1579 family protein [Xanthomonadaceae bacterium]|nr:DUF1579 family protein [Xanthomonadaceae bacterium]MDE2224991.1 DUF1579 family protein [Xanthomonadaceae bacterium]MDE2496568.1 DUF1579 family protein [Xanthomonadaceae bacterium]
MRAALFFVFLLLAPCIAFGQAQTNQTPKAGPAIQKLGYYVGTWRGQGETKGGPFGKAGKLSSEMTCSWFAGRFQIVCRGEETGPTGRREFLNVLSYNQKTKSYTQYSISSLGESEYDQGGSYDGNKLVYQFDEGAGKKHTNIRYTEAHVSPALMTYKAEAAVGGGPWMVIAEGKITKIK